MDQKWTNYNVKLQLYLYIISYSFMFRPPRPPAKNNMGDEALQCVSANPTRASRPTRLIQIAISRFGCQVTAKVSASKQIKKTDASQSHSQDNNNAGTLTSPKYSMESAMGENACQQNRTMGINPNGFKIRYMSSQGKRAKQNMEPNGNTHGNKMSDHVISIKMKDKKKKEQPVHLCKCGESNGCACAMQVDSLVANNREMNFYNYKPGSKTGVIRLSAHQPQQNCIVIPQTIFNEAITSQQSIDQLKTLMKSLTVNQQPLTTALKLSSPISLMAVQQMIQVNRIPIDYLIWNNQKTVSSCNFINLAKIGCTNYVLLCGESQWGVDVYACGNPSTLYGYYQGSVESLTAFAGRLRVEEGKIGYPAGCGVANVTRQHIENRQALANLQLKQEISHHSEIPNPATTCSGSLKQFDQQYRNKMIQLAKLLSAQKKEQNKGRLPPYPNSNQCIQVKLPACITQVMETSPSSSTAYQLVSQLIRNNAPNWEHIARHKQKCAGISN